MSDFLGLVFNYLVRAMILAVPAAAVCGVGLIVAAKLYQKKYDGQRRFPWGKAICGILLAGYLVMVLYVTVVRPTAGGWRDMNLHLFRAWREAWNSFSEKEWLNVFLNIGMFVPLGVLLPLLAKKLRKWYLMLPAGFVTSLAIELVQYITCRGLFDVDDLFTNTLGAMIGFWSVSVCIGVKEKSVKYCLRHGGALLAAAAAIGSIFAAYSLQEYGNLTTAPAFRADVSDVEWTVTCALSDETATAPVYRMDRPTKAECSQFGVDFLTARGIGEVDVWPYNDEVYLREQNGNRILEVYYLDGSYDYSDLDYNWDTVVWARLDEDTLRAALAEWDIHIPAEAEFAYGEDGWHIFRVSQSIDGDTMTDGTLRCHWEEGFGIREIENHLLTLTYQGDCQIISPMAAVERLKDGWLANGDLFEYRNIESASVVSCVLTYQVDTKGFYQPVYAIELAWGAGGEILTEYVAAIL